MIDAPFTQATETLYQRWQRYSNQALLAGIALMSFFGLRRMIYEFNRLLLRQDSLGAIDLRQRYAEVQAWFSGDPV
jgi:hypothetical protein